MRRLYAIITLLIILMAVPALARPLEVFVSIKPQKWLVEQIAGELVNTRVMVDKGQEPHGFEPTPGQLAALAKSSIYFTMNLPFEKMLLAKLNGRITTADTTEHIEFISFASHHDKLHNHTENYDPHVWLSPVNLIIMAENMAKTLSRMDGENSQVYKQNLARLTEKLELLDTEIKKLLAPFVGRSFYTFHPSFGYFASRYHLVQKTVETEGKSPGPKDLASLIKEARKDQVQVIFTQPQFDQKSSQVLARAINGRVIPLDTLAENVPGNLRFIAKNIALSMKK
ncbi:MAG: ABC transporter substrate-binding protein [Deltaproteobacteria bacterium]|nr:MAG: ABC transporter substrate-binding protein [Deltaproteobacteria bacterium]